MANNTALSAKTENIHLAEQIAQNVTFRDTDEELKRLFIAIDSFKPDSLSSLREYLVPVLFRMMYCCGMRPQEPASIRKEDFSLDTGEIYIRQSKRQRDMPHWIPLCTTSILSRKTC